MGLLTGLVTLPLAPVRGVAWIVEQIRDEAERQYYDQGAIRRQLTAVDDAYDAGELTAESRDELQDELLARLWEAQRRRRAGEL